MNDIIKEIMKQATYDVLGVKQIDQQLFAELIIMECAEVAGCNAHVSGFALGDLLKQHFNTDENN
jgi:hypothetical protein